MFRTISCLLGILFCIFLIMLFIPQISFPILIQLSQAFTKTHDTIINTAGGHRFLFEEEFLAGFPEDHFIYKIYEIKKGNKLLIADRLYCEHRIDKNLEYKYYNYEYNNQIINIYDIRGEFLIYKCGGNSRFIWDDLESVVDNADDRRYLTPFFRELLAKSNKDDIPCDVIEYLLKVKDVKSYKSIKSLCESIKKSCNSYDAWMNKYIIEIEKGNMEK